MKKSPHLTPLRKLTYSGLLLALAFLLPFVTGQIPAVGKLLSPMHLPAFLCGFLCGPGWGALVGFAAPLLRSLILGMPPILTAVGMTAELAAYGALAGLLYRQLPKKPFYLYLSLLLSMVGGRLVYVAASLLLATLTASASPSLYLPAVLLDTVTGTWVGILVQLVLIPPLVLLAERVRRGGAGE